ncbi:unnamed protein product [Rotaria sordida]|uniref:Organic cation transporter protein n=1 Tax=Rotaria sordida TaxID=392033 RepID=A0A819DJC6_9BILA|nr:unnamed protein product [Rotaria sordida]
MKFDTFYATVNDWGYYQKIKFFIICLANMVPPLIFYTWSFTAATPDFRCSLPLESDAYNSQMNHLYDTTYKPTIDDCATHQKLLSLKECQRCFIRIATHNTTSISKLHKCHDYVFDRSIYKKTLVEEWTMVCDRVLYRTAVQVAYFIGVMVGAVLFARFLLACSTRGISESGFVLSSELVSPRKRVMAGAVMTYFYAFGQLWLVLFAYFIRTWRMLLLTTSFLMLPYCLFYLFLPESPRWLISKGRFNEAEKVLRTIAIENKQKFSHEAYEQFKATQNRTRIWSNFPIVLYGVISLIAAGLAITFPETLNRPLPQTSEEVHRMGLAFGLLSDNKSKNKYDDDDDEPAAQILTINEDNEKQKSVENINGKP